MFLDEFFAEKSEDFYENGIMSLQERWQQVLDQNEPYISD